jgi:hypothetical protein
MMDTVFDWLKKHVYEINFFVAGWCAFAVLDCLGKGSYVMALINAGLVYLNIKFAKEQ